RKEISQIAMMHPRTFVAQTTSAHTNHFYKCVLEALEYKGPSIITCYTTCQPEHGVADNMAADQARLAVDTRAFPLLIHHPDKGDTLAERLTLQGNPAVNDDWWVNPKSGESVDFIDFCRSEGRFAKHFDREGNPSDLLAFAKQDRLENWRLLQELAGLRGKDKAKGASKPAAKKPAAAAKKPAAGNGLPAGFSVGGKIKYYDGANWIPGVLQSSSPAVLALDDETEISVPGNVLLDAIKEKLVTPQ
ncbi:MAG: hypothetical protein N2C14_30905, partial [Planctomycetales bacterium]